MRKSRQTRAHLKLGRDRSSIFLKSTQRGPRHERCPRSQVSPQDRYIHQRPEHATPREIFGGSEGALMIFVRVQGMINMASLLERQTRFAVLFRSNDRSSAHLRNKQMGVMGRCPNPRGA